MFKFAPFAHAAFAVAAAFFAGGSAEFVAFAAAAGAAWAFGFGQMSQEVCAA